MSCAGKVRCEGAMRCELREEEVHKCGGRPTEGLDLTALSAQRIAERVVRVRIGGQEGDLSVEGGFGVSWLVEPEISVAQVLVAE